MSLKGWMLSNKNAAAARDVRLRTPTATGLADDDPSKPGFNAFGRGAGASDDAAHLGPYAPLIGAIREELEQFVANQLRLHLAIAERDRYVLSSIEVECEGGEGERELLRRFVREFRPEQIKQYLAKEIIAGLRNASTIDLAQFAGLNAESEEAGASRDEERYGDLIAALASGAPRGIARPYRVTLVGRWSELAPVAESQVAPREGPRTPLAARPVAVDIEDSRGTRRIELAAVPGRRYSVGKGEGCEVSVDGVYASRRHCELWFDKGAWWTADAGSTNGIRVESADGGVSRDEGGARSAARPAPLSLTPGSWLVLAAHMRGKPDEYPRLSLHAIEAVEEASTTRGTLATPVTPIAAPRKRSAEWTLSVTMASGRREIVLAPDQLPFRIGRSRSQALVVDWAHGDVSGRHVEVVALDATGARIVVHGDNGVSVDGKVHGPGAEFHWDGGQTMRLGAAASATPCELTLARAD